MSRKAPIITLDELKLKMSKYIKSYDDPTYGDDEEFPWNLPSIAIDNDLTKIEFDFENCCIGENNENYEGYPCGYKVLPSGIPVLLVNAGGDWEFPICFALYFDGKSIRGYIPTEGNVFDKKNKSAYGNHDDCPEDEELLKLIDSVSIINDINTRIQTK
jgi:hypothetical protein